MFDLLKTNVMIDLETLSTKYNAGILSIGAVKFDYQGVNSEFYVNVKLRSSKQFNLDISPDTMNWWAQQYEDNPEILQEMFKNGKDLEYALGDFVDWYGPDSMNTWGNGSDFDLVILTNAFNVFGMKTPWTYGHINCYRTLKGLIDKDRQLLPPKNKMHHNALADAKWQAEHMINMWKVWAGEDSLDIH